MLQAPFPAKHPSAAEQAAEKLSNEPGFVSGHDFSRAVEAFSECRALAPATLFSICNLAAAKAGPDSILVRHG
jgi:hypothetical protein